MGLRDGRDTSLLVGKSNTVGTTDPLGSELVVV
jgi:hypothetical protein